MKNEVENPVLEIPKDWKVKALGDVASINMGQSPSSSAYNEEGNGIPLIQGNADIKNRQTVPRTWTTEFPKECQVGDIIMTVRAPVGAIARSMHHACLGRGVCAITSKVVDNGYLYQYLLSYETKWAAIEQGSTFTAVNGNEIRKIEIPLPPLPEQRRIAEILSTLDEKMAVMDEQLAQTQELKKGLMQRLLTKGIGHTQFKDSPLGEIPASWKAVQLKNVARFTNGKGHESCIVDDGAYVVVNSKFISSDTLVSKRSNHCLAPLLKGQIVMVMSDVPNGKAIAKCFLIDADNKYTLNQRVCAIEAVQMDAKYLFYILNRNPYYLEFDNGISQTNLRKDEVLHCPISLPPLPEQRQIAEILTTVDDKIGVLQDKKAQYQTLKRGLMQQLLTGQRRVRVPEPAAA